VNMRRMNICSPSGLLLLLALGLSFSSRTALGCKCIAPPPGLKDAHALAEWKAQRVDVVFEGTVDGARLESPLLDASAGELIPANLEAGTPTIIVSFSANQWYRGLQQDHVEIETGLGGGDCGFPFEVGKQYLVYAYREESGRLSTGICTATDLLDESKLNLASLRGEPIPSADSSGRLRGGRPRSASRICGDIVKDQTIGPEDNPRLTLSRLGSVSPLPSEEAELNENGHFCFSNLDRGEYRLLFTNTVGETAVTSYVYYPGVTQREHAAHIHVGIGQDSANLVFKIPAQELFSVAGAVSSPNNSPLPANTKVILIAADGSFVGPAYGQDVSTNGSFVIPAVLPGKYWALLDVDSADSENTKWSAIKTELTVTGSIDHLSLTLIPSRAP